jgi:hypothetical protein
MEIINMKRRPHSMPIVLSYADMSFAFQWQSGTIDIYAFQLESEFRQGLENHHQYESPAEGSGRIIWCSNPQLLERIRGGA